MTQTQARARALAFHLPQFHPIPENDVWWGKGFTDWTNVAKARPLFRGHYQPHLPADLGFYDLRLPEVRIAQAEMARAYGIEGFCYYHYWFHGRRMLERPVNEILSSGEPDFPFCLCWANESWSRTWDGRSKEFLIEQRYSEEDDLNHIRWLAEVFADPRYVRINGKPVFLVYRAKRLPDPRRTTEIWREEAIKLGIGELMLCCVESFDDEHGDPRLRGFDAAIEFQPDWKRFNEYVRPLRRNKIWRTLHSFKMTNTTYRDNNVYNYADLVRVMMEKPAPPYPRFPGITPSWDNTARRINGATVFANGTPEQYATWLRAVVTRLTVHPRQERLLFINAWNEWAEGNHLEPDRRWGHAYLEATKRVLLGVGGV